MNMNYNSSYSQHQPCKNQITSSNNLYSHSSSTTRDDIASEAANIFPCRNPHTSNKSDLTSRLDTYSGWPNHIKASPLQLAEAGFLYLGHTDRLKCFYCNGGLQKWQYSEDPWFEHAKWYPNCEYLLRCKGIEYVSSVAGRFPSLKRPTPNRERNPSPSSSPASLSNSISHTSSCSLPLSSSHIEADDVPSTSSSVPRSNNTSLDEALTSFIVEQAFGMGFDQRAIFNVVKRKLSEGSVYTSALSLVEDVQCEEERLSSLPQNDLSDADLNSLHLQKSQENTKLPPLSIPKSSFSVKTTLNTNLELNSVGSEDENQSPTSPFPEDAIEVMQTIQNEQTCKVCLDRKSNCLFQPCGHLCCCIECGSVLNICPICRVKIVQIIKIYR